jgi:deoxyribodipyrimidine photolyase-related protein
LFGALPRIYPSTRVGAADGPVVTVLRIILGDQLSLDLSALNALVPGRDTVLMMEVMEENTYVRHHKQKIVLVLAAMRHFAETLSLH